MRNVPYYHTVYITEENLNNFKQVIKSVDNRYNPYIIDFSKLEAVNFKILYKIEETLSLKIRDFNLPYPIFFLGNYHDYKGRIKLFKTPQDIPEFYFQKEKRLTRVHTNASRMNVAIEKNIQHDDRSESYRLLKYYAEQNKVIHQLNYKKNYLEKLLEDIKDLS